MKYNCYAEFSNNISKNIDDTDFSFAPFLMWNDHKTKYFEKMKNINTIDYNNNIELMKKTYFSYENTDIIQNTIIKKIYIDSNEKLKIKKIKNETIIQIMNYIWETFCKFLPYDLKNQIIDLNNKTIDYIFPILKKEANFYSNYLRDSDRSNIKPIERPVFVTNKKELPSYIK